MYVDALPDEPVEADDNEDDMVDEYVDSGDGSDGGESEIEIDMLCAAYGAKIGHYDAYLLSASPGAARTSIMDQIAYLND